MAQANRLAVKDLYSVCEQVYPSTYAGQIVNLTLPAHAPTNADEYATQFHELHALVHCIIGSSIQTFTSVTTIR